MTIDKLRQEITRLTRTERLFKLNEIAEKAGVSASYITNFLNQKERGFSPEVKSAVENAVLDLSIKYGDVSAIRALYLDFLVSNVEVFDFRFALPSVSERQLGLAKIDEIFVERCYKSIDILPKEYVGLDELFQAKRVVHLLGPAGCGKTTAIRHEILRLAKLQDRNSEGVLPIFFPLNAVNRASYDPRENENLLDLICKWTQIAGQVDARSVLVKALENGRAFVMLDGLDEVQPDHFHSVREMINRFIRIYIKSDKKSGNRLLVTDRGNEPFGLDGEFDDSMMFQILGFDSSRVGELVDKWVALAEVDYPPDKIRRFKEAIVEQPLRHLTKRALFLTLMTVIFLRRNPEELFVSPSTAAVMHLFYRTVLGLWNNVRSLDGFPTPVADEIPQELAQRLLSHLAWAMVDDDGKITSEISLYSARQSLATCYKRYEFSPHSNLPDDLLTLNRVDAFLDRCKDAGILVIYQDHEQTRVRFLHTLEHSWFLTISLRQNPETLQQYLDSMVRDVSPLTVRWKEPLTLGLGAMGPVDGNIDGLTDAVEYALGTFPLDSEKLQRILPMGLDLCLHLVAEGGLYAGASAKIFHHVSRFYETTEYAVVTNCLQSVIVDLLGRGSWGKEIPRETTTITRWLAEIGNLADSEWAAEIDKIWRYQTDIRCFQLLLDAVTERLEGNLVLQKLCRRLVFGSRFAEEGAPYTTTIKFLKRVLNDQTFDPVIKAMADYVMKEIRERMSEETNGAAVKGSSNQALSGKKDEDCVKKVKSTTLSLLVGELAKCRILVLAKERGSILAAFMQRTKSKIDDVIRELVALTRKDHQDDRERAIAVILLAGIFETSRFSRTFADLHPNQQYSFVLDALLDAADATEERQYDNVDACQVYDFAAWAVRAIFLQTHDLSGLPLPPRGWRSQ